MENLVASGRRKAMEELVRGRDFANQLRLVINGDHHDGSATTPLAEQLVKKVLMSFTNSLTFLNNPTSHENFPDVPYGVDPAKSEDSQDSICNKSSSSPIKQRRGCYKRRRNTQTMEKDSESPIDDGHQWRKYGQKVILKAKYPRNYYRCTHKFDQGCQATKQVQQLQEDPPLHRTTYYGHHTCRNLLNSEIILDNNSPSDSSMFLSFDNSLPTPSKQDCPFLLSSIPPPSSSSVKKECKEEIPSSSSNEYLLSSELTFDDSKHVTLSSTLDSDHPDMIPDVLYDSTELDDVFSPFLEF